MITSHRFYVDVITYPRPTLGAGIDGKDNVLVYKVQETVLI